GLHVRCDDLQISLSRLSPADCGIFPFRHGISLPCRISGRRFRGAEMKETGLSACVRIDPERCIVLPRDVKSSRHAHESGRSEPPAGDSTWQGNSVAEWE